MRKDWRALKCAGKGGVPRCVFSAASLALVGIYIHRVHTATMASVIYMRLPQGYRLYSIVSGNGLGRLRMEGPDPKSVLVLVGTSG